ncbi:MAG: glycoside hydrolase family 43 protein [Gammaproteobacteria bacterium]
MKPFLTAVLVLAAGTVGAAPQSWINPVISGFHPDPSICRVGGDYYLVNSTFEYYPGVPVFHSRDLVHWRQIGHALDRRSQLKMDLVRSSGGIYAPTLRCHGGRFYMITTNVDGGGNFYVHADNPAGPWSEPVWIKERDPGIDPSLLFDDDGKVYYTRHGGGEKGGIVQSEIDIATGRLLTEPRVVWRGTGGVWPEGPHLYKIGAFYYLMIAEGGTSYGHAITLARASSPWGPFEPAPNNPVLTQRDRVGAPIQATGHGDLVQAEDGRWWMVLLGVRPRERQHHIGRETMLAPATWDAQGWLQAPPVAPVMSAEGLPAPHPWPASPIRDEFNGRALGLQWNTLRGSARSLYSLTARPGALRLNGGSDSLETVGTPAFVGRRQEHLRARAATEVAFTPGPGQSAGLALRMNEANHYLLRIVGEGAGKRRAELVTRVKGATTVHGSVALAGGPVTLQVQAWPDRYDFSVRAGKGGWQTVGGAPTAALSSEQAGGFTGVYLGMFATGTGAQATFNWFDYEPLDSSPHQ